MADVSLVQVVVERFKPGQDQVRASIESDTACACAEYDCPHPHLALKPIDKPDEVWWLNFFESEAHRQAVTDEYAANAPLMKALARNSEKKSVLRIETENSILALCSDNSGCAAPEILGSRFLVLTKAGSTEQCDGTVFEGDGNWTEFQFAKSLVDANQIASKKNAATILSICPSWGRPSSSWIAADPEFWSTNPSAKSLDG